MLPEGPSRNDNLTLACLVCGRLFRRAGRRAFCSDACRQAAWRRRHPTLLPTVPTRAPRVSTVYQCPACDSRYLGEQYCSDCGRFCRRVGAGGLCPACDEPVALSDLLPELRCRTDPASAPLATRSPNKEVIANNSQPRG
jgi:hypothetical protein